MSISSKPAHIKLATCIIFFYWCDKILDKGHFSGERASLGSQFEGHSPPWQRRQRWQKSKDPDGSPIRKQRESG